MRTNLISAGRASLMLDGGTVRAFTVGGVDVVQSLGIRFRDTTWNTAENLVRSQSIDEREGRVRIETTGRSLLDDIDCEWTWEVELSAENTLVVALRARALTDFEYARIGHVAMLTPETYIGAECNGRDVAGEHTSFVIPELVAAQVMIDGVDHSPFPRVSELTAETSAGHLKIRSNVTAVEMEDQRNWTDNSFKLYTAGPANVGPLIARKGQVFEERLRFEWIESAERPEGVRATIESSSNRPIVRFVETDEAFPSIGTTYPSHPFEIPGASLDDLAGLGLSRLRLELFPDQDPGEEVRVTQAVGLASSLGASLTVAVHIPRRADAVAFVTRALERPELRRVEAILPLGDDLITNGEHIEAVKRWRDHVEVDCEVLAGSDAHFMELNASAAVPAADGIAWPMSPQMHEQDETTILLNSRGQRASVMTAQDRFGPEKIVISPVTLRPRFNSEYAKANGHHPGPVPSETDPRQHSNLAAVWTLASVAHLAPSGADAIDYFELAGPAGILTSEGGDTPVSLLLRALSKSVDKPVLAGVVEPGFDVAAVGWTDPGADNFVIANLTHTEQPVRVVLRERTFDVAIPPLGALRGVWDGRDVRTDELIAAGPDGKP